MLLRIVSLALKSEKLLFLLYLILLKLKKIFICIAYNYLYYVIFLYNRKLLYFFFKLYSFIIIPFY